MGILMARDTNGKRHQSGEATRGRLTATMATDTIALVKGATLGQRLRNAREKRGLKTNELNRLVRLPDGKKLSDGYISSLETERRKGIPAAYAAAIADTLRIRTDWLVEGRGPAEFISGEMPAMETAAKLNKPHLERVLSAANVRGRWSEQTVAAARALDADRQLSEWPGLLDRLERAIRKAIGSVTA